MSRPVTLAQARAQYPHRFTMDHVPAWARQNMGGKFYAPQYRSDAEWYENTLFPGESDLCTDGACFSMNQTWPLGKWLDSAYKGV